MGRLLGPRAEPDIRVAPSHRSQSGWERFVSGWSGEEVVVLVEECVLMGTPSVACLRAGIGTPSVAYLRARRLHHLSPSVEKVAESRGSPAQTQQ